MNYTDMTKTELEDEYSRLMDLLTDCSDDQVNDIVSEMDMIEDELDTRDPWEED